MLQREFICGCIGEYKGRMSGANICILLYVLLGTKDIIPRVIMDMDGKLSEDVLKLQ